MLFHKARIAASIDLSVDAKVCDVELPNDGVDGGDLKGLETDLVLFEKDGR